MAEWYEDIFRRIESLADLELGWDSYEAEPIQRDCIEATKEMAHALGKGICEHLSVVPCVDGGVQLESHLHGLNLEISITRD